MSSITISGNYFIQESGGNVQGSIDKSSWSNLSFPISITTTASGNINFINSLIFSNSDDYFIIDTVNDSLTIDALGIKQNITASGYNGLFQNGTSVSSGQSNVNIQNFSLDCSGSSLSVYGGWLCQQYYSNTVSGNYIFNCNSDGDISQYGGGIIGSNISNNGGSCTIKLCYSLGSIGQYGGGICGNNANSCTANSCYSIGNIGNYGGGIFGANASGILVNDTYSIGTIGDNAGGIVGDNCINSFIENSYSGGIISVTNAGGIVGSNSNSCTISHCYTYGAGPIGNGILGNNAISDTITDCYAEADHDVSGWNYSIASSVLYTGRYFPIPPTATTPALLTDFNIFPFSTYIHTVYPGGSINNTLNSFAYSNFKLIYNNVSGISIDNSGVITVANDIPLGIYPIYILNYDNFINSIYYSYNIFNYYFEVIAIPPTPISNNVDFNNLVQINNNIVTLPSNFITDTPLYIYLPKTYIFNGGRNSITVNTSTNNTLFQLQSNPSNPCNEKTIIQNLHVIGATLINDEKNVTISNCCITQNNYLFYTPLIGDNCSNINIYNCIYRGIGTLIGNNCSDISIISNDIKTKLILPKTAAITGKNCEDIDIKNCKISVSIYAKYCSSIIGYKNKNINVSNVKSSLSIQSKNCATFVCGKSNKVSIFKCVAKIKSHKYSYYKYFIDPAKHISIKKSYVK